MFPLAPSNADRYWYLSRVTGIAGMLLTSVIALGVDLIPSSSVDFLIGIWLLAVVPAMEYLSSSTPLHEELDLGED